MPARLLRREGVASAAATAWTAGTMAAPAARAVVAKILVVAANGAPAGMLISVSVGPNNGAAILLAWQTPINPGETWEQSGVVIPTGDKVFLRTESAAGLAQLHVFGEELDN